MTTTSRDECVRLTLLEQCEPNIDHKLIMLSLLIERAETVKKLRKLKERG